MNHRQHDWAKAEADFPNWPYQRAACDGTAIRCHPSWGEGVYEAQTKSVISPIAYSVRRSLRLRGITPIGED